ncbi:terpene synthase 04 [Euphorbia peplus]|nr:terpene synthase 04 [Euphorbia peplus]
MENSKSSIEALVEKVKKQVFAGIKLNPYSLISISAYDTAWLAMVSDPLLPKPMFQNCLNWVLQNQKKDGFWGEFDGHGNLTFECLPATIACMVALKRWNVGHNLIAKGMEFIEAKGEELIGEINENCPSWFAIIFPRMLELALSNGLQISIFSDGSQGTVMEIFNKRHEILKREREKEKKHYPPLLSYAEALADNDYNIDEQQVLQKLDKNGSLFQSPSATARAYMLTGNIGCLLYLQSLVQKCPYGVPATYPVDEDLINLCFINQLQRLGLTEHFDNQIHLILQQIYKNYMDNESWGKPALNPIAQKLYKDSLAFWLLRMHGYNVSPRIFCWFLEDEEVRDHIQKNHEYFSSIMLNVHKATDLMFPEESQLEEAKLFSRNLLEKSLDQKTNSSSENFHSVIRHELRYPWLARLDHLEHRMWIEEKNINALWMGKASFVRFSSFYNDKLMQLATSNYEFRQSIYLDELQELKRWSKSMGLTEMGFGREKTTYCYFAVSASTSLPQDSDVRLMVAKSAIIITVADDFYDMEGSLYDLNLLTFAIQRWNGRGLSGHSRTIFNVLDDHVSDMSAKHLQRHGSDITNHLRSIWYETFNAWLIEATWSRTGYIPSRDEYLKIGSLSIAARDLLLPASCFLNPSLPVHKLTLAHHQDETITQLAMILPRLLNDMQSYQKEEKEGKMNIVLLHMKENPGCSIEDSIAHVKAIVDEKKREFIKYALMEDGSVSKQFRQLHLSCLKTFQMFFDSSNRYDSSTDMILDIQKAIYLPLQHKINNNNIPSEMPILTLIPPLSSKPNPAKSHLTVARCHFMKQNIRKFTISYVAKHANVSRNGSMNVFVQNCFKPCIL